MIGRKAAAHSREHLGNAGSHHCSTAIAETADLLQSPVMSRRLQPFERMDVQRLVNSAGEYGAGTDRNRLSGLTVPFR